MTNNGVAKSAGPYDFVTYGANGYVKATYGATAVSAATGTTVVDETASQTLAANAVGLRAQDRERQDHHARLATR